MFGKRSRSFAASVATFAVLLAVVLSPAGPAMRRGYAIVVSPGAPSWLQPGEYLLYNQSYTIDGLTASINVKDTFLSPNSSSMRIQSFGPRVPAGFAMPGLVYPYDSASQPPAMLCHTISRSSSSSSVQCTTDQGIQGGFSDPTAFVGELELTYANATVVPLHLAGQGSPPIQAWKVNETALDDWIYGMPRSSGAIGNASFVWFDKDTSVKVRESANYTNTVYEHYIVSVEKLEDTNIPQLESALATQGSSSSTLAKTSLPSSSSTTNDVVQPANHLGFEESALIAVALVAITAMALYFTKGKLSISQEPEPGGTPH